VLLNEDGIRLATVETASPLSVGKPNFTRGRIGEAPPAATGDLIREFPDQPPEFISYKAIQWERRRVLDDCEEART